VSEETRRTFWLDRARTAAIARHTNAFKINEDVVIPLARLGEYTDEIERINIERSTANKLRMLDALQDWLGTPFALGGSADPDSDGCRSVKFRPKFWATGSSARWSWSAGCGGAGPR